MCGREGSVAAAYMGQAFAHGHVLLEERAEQDRHDLHLHARAGLACDALHLRRANVAAAVHARATHLRTVCARAERGRALTHLQGDEKSW